jgi:glycosyltransferase involved in cell wall biosynthesis
VPLLLADLPGLRELGEDGACARVLTPGDHEAWAREAGVLIADPARWPASRKAARGRAEAVHALPVRGAALAEFYGRLRR